MKSNLGKVVAVIPSLSPNYQLYNYVESLVKVGFNKIIIVNDGSNGKYDEIYDKVLKSFSEVILLKHSVNEGKGRALKTAFHYYLNNFEQLFLQTVGIVTADADGQHSANDTKKVAAKLVENQECIVLGSRNFNGEIVPFKSKFGNKITSHIFRLITGTYLKDTQTGLRAFSKNIIKDILKLNGERFEYEINVLIYSTRKKITIIEEDIETIYEEGNRETHFDAVKDSIRIYKVMFREFASFMFAGLSSSIIDIAFFALFLSLLNFSHFSYNIFMATIFARIISSLYNYTVNKNVVFKNKGKKRTLLYYYILCIIQMVFSGLFTSGIVHLLAINASVGKILVDIVLFCFSYSIQSRFIFAEVRA